MVKGMLHPRSSFPGSFTWGYTCIMVWGLLEPSPALSLYYPSDIFPNKILAHLAPFWHLLFGWTGPEVDILDWLFCQPAWKKHTSLAPGWIQVASGVTQRLSCLAVVAWKSIRVKRNTDYGVGTQVIKTMGWIIGIQIVELPQYTWVVEMPWRRILKIEEY